MAITKKQEELIEELLRDFNFEKVLVAMTALDWKWNNFGEPYSVPTIARMKSHCRSLLYTSVTDECVSSGGFKAKYYPADSDLYVEAVFSLCFELEETYTSS
jgi:hypothetical protein